MSSRLEFESPSCRAHSSQGTREHDLMRRHIVYVIQQRISFGRPYYFEESRI